MYVTGQTADLKEIDVSVTVLLFRKCMRTKSSLIFPEEIFVNQYVCLSMCLIHQ